MSLLQLLPPDHGFTREEIARVAFEPFGVTNIFRCRKCGWWIERSGFGLTVPYFVAQQGVREVVHHWETTHR